METRPPAPLLWAWVPTKAPAHRATELVCSEPSKSSPWCRLQSWAFAALGPNTEAKALGLPPPRPSPGKSSAGRAQAWGTQGPTCVTTLRGSWGFC